MRFSRSKTAVVLGCGPAGMFAAHALTVAGFDVRIWSKHRKSHMYGAQYLHREVPGLAGACRPIRYMLDGTAEGYADKVYGGQLSGREVSPSMLTGTHPGWDIRAAYDDAWERYHDLVVEFDISFPALRTALIEANPKVCVSTIPATLLCAGGHYFNATEVWAIGDAPDRGQIVKIPCDPDTVVCNGELQTGWYRKANVFGYTTIEWPGNRKPPIHNVAKVNKPLQTNCDCLPAVVRTGRYGKWQKGVLSHEAYWDAMRASNG